MRGLTVNHELSANHQKQLILVLVRMPGKVALPFRDLHVLIVDTADDLRRPELFEELFASSRLTAFVATDACRRT